ncbi:hypothetical protein HDU98_000395 [Podochytrium sp. JEL0797]|nr:hypothetical protein HDU98_000395 [Podochytrium sp. JEL0797]
MISSFLLALLCIFDAAIAAATVHSNQLSQRKTLAYFTDYSLTSVLQDADLAHMDILIYAFIHVDANGGCSFGNADLTNLHFALAQRVAFPNLQVVLSVGATAQVFSSATSTEVTRTAFARNCVGLMNQVKADGLDIDWEVPQAGDAANLLAIMQLLRSTLGTSKTLSMATATDLNAIQSANLPALSPYLDWYGVMSYSYYSPLGLSSNPTATTDLDNIVRTFLFAGIPPSQIVVAIAFYGYTCKLSPGGTKSDIGDGVVQANNELMALGLTGTTEFENFTFTEYLFSSTGDALVYNTPLSAQLKAQYVVDTALYGLMMWEFSQDSTLGMYNTIASVFQTAPTAHVTIVVPQVTGVCNGTVVNPRCGGAEYNWGACPLSQCCSEYHYCTDDPKFCGASAMP